MRLGRVLFALALSIAVTAFAASELDASRAAANPCSSPGGDTDGDGLPNGWECGNARFAEGTLNLKAMGADPRRRDIFVECDYMKRAGKNLQPTQEAVDMVAEAFNKAPVKNPDGSRGVTIHIDAGNHSANIPASQRKGNALAYQQDWPDVPQVFADNGPFMKLKAKHFQKVRQHAFHYCIFANNYGAGSSSGLAFTPGNDFMVTLGHPDWGAYPRATLTQEQAGSLMHELGHNLGLQHGGGDEVNYKPNYLSIMSYTFQISGLIYQGKLGHLDYSRFLAGDLNENRLSEPAGVAGPRDIRRYGTTWSCPDGSFFNYQSPLVADTNVADGVDWNCNGRVSGNVRGNINSPFFNPDAAGRTVLKSFNDWPNLVYAVGDIGSAGTRSFRVPRLVVEIDAPEALRIRDALRQALLPDWAR